ncbi:MAG: prenyltransferase/squalene oxidase repeat-containing protein [Planctomycetaceae bacterium]
MIDAADTVSRLLLDERTADGWWEGQLSTSALSTATAVMALSQAVKTADNQATVEEVENDRRLIRNGLQWLAAHQNSDGGWGDTVMSISNISTSMLVNAVFHASGTIEHFSNVVKASQAYIDSIGGVDAVVRRYGKDHTFSVPILTHCALAGIVDWKRVMPLPFELACIPARFYAAVRMPVVSYALPALIAIGQVIFRHQGHWNPVVRWIRRAAISPSLKVLERIQPENGGFLEATPLTSFVCMSLLGCGLRRHIVTERCLSFIRSSVRSDGSWPIDTNLTTWVTTLSVNALANTPGPGLKPSERTAIRNWLLKQQYQTVHPYTNAAPGGWSWTDLPGGVPDADDTPGAMLAVLNLRPESESFEAAEIRSLQMAAIWLLDLQNRDGGWPTFCRGWGTLPFDRSSNDLTAHAMRALTEWQRRVPDIPAQLHRRTRGAVLRGLKYLQKNQRSDGTWLPLWFGHQFHSQEENPLYGTAKVLPAVRAINHDHAGKDMIQKAATWLLQNQNPDGGWSAVRGLVSSVEETGLAMEALAGIPEAVEALQAGRIWLENRIQDGSVSTPSPIGFYFAKLWYFERLYPLIFATAALRKTGPLSSTVESRSVRGG